MSSFTAPESVGNRASDAARAMVGAFDCVALGTPRDSDVEVLGGTEEDRAGSAVAALFLLGT